MNLMELVTVTRDTIYPGESRSVLRSFIGRDYEFTLRTYVRVVLLLRRLEECI